VSVSPRGSSISEMKDKVSGTPLKETTSKVGDSQGKDFTCGFAMDKRAKVDDAFLLVGINCGQHVFKNLVGHVHKLTEEHRKRKVTYSEMKRRIIALIKRKDLTQSKPILKHDLTRIVNNVITQGTTIFTLAPTGNENLLLIVKGAWSGGAFLPSDNKHKAISNSAVQHYKISFSMEKKLVMEPCYEFTVDLAENSIHIIGDEALGFVSNRKSI